MIKSKTNHRSFAGSIRARSIKAAVLCVLLYSIIPLYGAQAVEFCNGGSVDVMGGEYHVMNNVWGSCPGVGEQCIDVDLDSTYFSVTYSTHTGGCVASYPMVYKGCHWGNCTQDSGMPLKVNEIVTTPFSWSVDTNGAGGTWNVAMDIWFSKTGGTAPDAAEMMIWINHAGGAWPAGTKVGTVSIGGADWDVYFVDWTSSTGWYYIAYKRTSTTGDVSLDLKDFISDSVNRGYISPSWYLDAIEAGFEIWSDGEGLTNNSFSASVTAGPANIPPTVFITSLEDGIIFPAGSDITIDADASDSDGSVTKVEFYEGSTKLGEDTTAPYSYTWNDVPTGSYSFTAKATDDRYDSNTSPAVNIEVIGGTGTILCEWWTGIAGAAVSDLTSSGNYPDKPSGRELITGLEGPTNWADNYGTRIRGYLHPADDGSYTFWIASDANSEMWLSTDDSPANKTRIAYVPGWTNSREWTKYPEQQSSPIPLVSGGKYYIEVLHKEASGNDNIAVAWGPNPIQEVIDGMLLSPCCLDFGDFSRFAAEWRLTSCNAGNSWCGGADFNRDGSVLLDDLKLFAESWLAGVE